MFDAMSPSVGDADPCRDTGSLRADPHVVCGTPGRILDNIQKGALRLRDLRGLVLDEVDLMLEIGFEQQVRDIFAEVPGNTQVIITSATMSEKTLQIADRFLRNPLRILLKEDEVTLRAINQFHVRCDDGRVEPARQL